MLTGAGATARAPRAVEAGLAALLVAGLTLFAWRGLFSAQLFADDYSLLDSAAREDLATSLWQHGPGFFAEGGDPYFRPLWRWLIELVHTLGGEEPRAWFGTSLALHVLVTLGLFALVARWTARPWLAAAAASAFALAPGPAQAVAWSAAALNLLPCAGLLLVAGAALWRWIERAEPRALGLCLAALLTSFGFREAAYQFLPLALVSVLFVRPLRARARGMALFVLALAALVSVHYAWLNRIEAGEARVAAGAALRGTVVVLRDTLGVPLGRELVLGGALAFYALAAGLGRPRTRFALLWSLCALFPYVAKFPSSRFQYLFQLPLWLALALLADDLALRAGGRARVARALGVAVLGAGAAWNAWHLPAARAPYAADGELCRRTLRELAALDLAGARTIAVDQVPRALTSAVPPMLRRLGLEAEFQALVVYRRPPFLLHAGELGALAGSDVVVLTWDERAERYAKTDLAGLAPELVPLPMFALCPRARVVAGPAEAVELLRAGGVATDEVLLYTPPEPPLVPLDGAPPRCTITRQLTGYLELEAESASGGYLALRLPSRLTGERALLIDGTPAALVPADGPFQAVRLRPGRHVVWVGARGLAGARE
jgi:hypothetical protein